jgi:hypothetical protein
LLKKSDKKADGSGQENTTKSWHFYKAILSDSICATTQVSYTFL